MTKLLLIEDDEVDQISFKRLVKNKRLLYDYAITSSIAEAKRVIANNRFDIIITDYSLCDGTAFDVFDVAKAVPIIVITGHGDEAIAVNAMKRGAYDYLVKDNERNYLKILPVIIEKAITHNKIEEQVKQFSRILEDSFNEIYIFDAKSLFFVHVNKGARKNLGYSMDELAHMTPLDLKTEYTRETFNALIEPLRSGEEEIVVFETTHKRKDGTVYPVEVRLQLNRDQKTQVFFAIILDITEHRLAEKEKRLREEEIRYGKLIKAANDAIFVADTDTGIIIDANKKAEELLDMPASSIIGMHYTQLYPKEDVEFCSGIFKDHVEKGKGICGISGDVFVGRKDGSKIAVEISSSVIEIGGRKIIQGIFRDITDRIKMEEELKATKEQLQSIIDNTTAVIYLKDIKGRFILINRQYEEIFHITRKEIIGKTDNDIFPGHKDLADTFRANDKKVLEALKPLEIEEIVPHDDGLHTYISIKFPLYDSTGAPYGVCGISTDITDRKKSEREILEIEDKERQRIGRDLHDSLGQLLTGIAFKSETLHHILKENGIDEADQAADIETLVNTAINQTRTLAKGALIFDKDDESLIDAFNELTLNVKKIYSISCNFYCGQDFEIKDRAIATHLYRIGQEAVNNSVKHANANSIDIRLFSDDRESVLTIKDDGIGIPALLQKNKGIGLRTMSYRASIIGASLDIQRDPGGGTIVTCFVG